ncbi:MAG: hypothetical protein K1Y36_04110 [Blastocatellia bacterium]|nr:hypothetical protein [Blastocatellia bacterium]
MGYHALQRVVVRLLFDPAFVEAVYANPETAFAGVDVSEAERQQVLQTDRRAWGYDQLRRQRSLRALADEFKSSVTLALAETRSLRFLEAYFSSPFFHEAVQNRGSMGLSFAAYLAEMVRQGTLKTPQLPDILRLETTLAACRRELPAAHQQGNNRLPKTLDDATVVQLAPAFSVGSFNGNVVSIMQSIESYLFEVSLMPAMVLCDDAPRLTGLPPVEPKKKVFMQFQPGGAGINLIQIERDEFLVLYETKKPKSIGTVLSRARTAGVSIKKATEILAEAVENRVVSLIAKGSAG